MSETCSRKTAHGVPFLSPLSLGTQRKLHRVWTSKERVSYNLLMKLTLKTPVRALHMVGPTYAGRLNKLDIDSVGDLLMHPPRRYEDYSRVSPIGSVQNGEVVTIRGQVKTSRNVFTRSHKTIQKIVITDQTGTLKATWFNQPYIPNTLKPGSWVSLAGTAQQFGKGVQFTSPEYEKLSSTDMREKGTTIHTGRLVPVYPETKGVSSKWIRSRIAPLLPLLASELEEWLPESILKQESLVPLPKAIVSLHFPSALSEAKKAWGRLAFEEMVNIQLAVQNRRKSWDRRKLGKKLVIEDSKLNVFLSSLPFRLTQAQRRVTQEVLGDLGQDKPMNRLLQGDVGSGKTVIAAIAIYAAFISGEKSALMAPTEILAMQHLETIKKLLAPFGMRIAMVTSSMKENLTKYDVAIGTHALLYKTVETGSHALVVIDEQHRFGVEQRALLIKKSRTPHILTMTATPIPRTVALTLYGDLDLSILDEMPPGRVRIKTWVIPPHKRESAYRWMRERIKLGEQAFIVCPLIEESTNETMLQVRAATEEFDRLKDKVFPDLALSLLHGRLSSRKKEEEIQKFRKGKTNILVTTPVVEVGIDITNATVMMIEGAERFGLAQLHQLRGRVGRGIKESYCLLFPSNPKTQGLSRLRILGTAKSGGQLAEFDLKLRGPGEIYGTKQHGYVNLKYAELSDTRLIATTQRLAREILEENSKLLKLQSVRTKLSTLEKDIEPN